MLKNFKFYTATKWHCERIAAKARVIASLQGNETARNTECKLALAVPRYAITLRRKINFSE